MTLLEQLELARQDAQADMPDCEEYRALAIAVSDTEVARLRPEWAKTARQIARQYPLDRRTQAKRKRHLARLASNRDKAFARWYEEVLN